MTEQEWASQRLARLRRLHELRRAEAARRAAAESDQRYANDPVGWVRDRLREHLWSKQRQVIEAVRDHPRVAVPSAHSTGKSFTAARTVGWWLSVHEPGTAFAITTAPTNSQVKAILWREVNRMHGRGNLPGRTNLTEWYMNAGGGDELVAFGRKSADTDPDSFVGIHAEHLLIVIDEANGFAPLLWEAADTLASGGDAHILAIGNPDTASSHFAKVTRPNSGWHVIRIPAYVTPAWTDEEVPDHVRRQLIQPEWVERKRREWGTDHPYWSSKVLAEFPDVDEALVIAPSLVARAHALWEEVVDKDADALEGPRTLGVDVARFGTDMTMLGVRHGPRFRIVQRMGQSRTTEVSAAAVRHAREHGLTQLRVDADGIGSGVVDELEQVRGSEGTDPLKGKHVMELHSGAAARDADQFVNARSEWWFHLRDLLRDGLAALDPEDEELAEQLTNVRYDVDKRGRLRVESKEHMRSRGVSSPDAADCAVYAFAPVVPPPLPSQVPEDHVAAAQVGMGVPVDPRPVTDVDF